MTDPTPTRWQLLASDLRERIASGEHAPGSRLPSKAALMAQHEVSDRTVLGALGALQREGLVYAVPSRGWFVRPRRAVVRSGRNRLSRAERAAGYGTFASDCRDAGLEPGVDPHEPELQPAPEDVAAALGIATGELVVVRDRRMRADGEPLQLATSYLPAHLRDVAPAIAEYDSGPGGVYARLDEAGVTLTSFTETVALGRADEHEASQLGVPPGEALLRVERVAYAGEQAVEVNRIRLRGDRVVLVYDRLPAE